MKTTARKKPEVIVRYNTFGHRSKNAAHIYANIFYQLDGASIREPLSYILTHSEAEAMNRYDRHDSYKEGDDTRRFLNVTSLKRHARKRASELFPDGFTLKIRECM